MDFLGYPMNYWIELQKRAQGESGFKSDLLIEIANLKGLVGFYESRIKEMVHVMNKGE